ncbi:MAG: sulfite exporter TauE/SafE family protein [Desulfobacterales bacterium]|nr:sulfite exporter TauE/SafE family protein [Desulfobacterales bacterium]
MIIKALTLGLSTGAFCMSLCGPVLIGLMFSREERDLRSHVKMLGLFLCGRLCAYLAFGAVSYYLGSFLGDGAFFDRLLPGGYILLGGLMVIHGAGARFPHWSLCRRTSRLTAGGRLFFITGALTGINLCPPFLLAVGAAMGAASVLRSMAFFLVFFLATSIYLIPFLFSAAAARSDHIRAAASIVCGLTGAYFIFLGFRIFLN